MTEPTRATLEGLESDNNSEGLGLHSIEYTQEPTVDQRFAGIIDGYPFLTSVVHSVKHFSATKIGFRTKHTTYMLEVLR